MSSAPVPSIFVKNLSASCRFLQRTYAEEQSKRFPDAAALSTAEGGSKALRFFAEELGIGARPLELWRSHQFSKANRMKPSQSLALQNLTLRNPTDAHLLSTSIDSLGFVLSPFVRLVRADETAAVATRSSAAAPPTELGSQFVAHRDIPAGMLLMSLPTESALTSSAPLSEAGDLLLDNHLHIDDLVAQLWSFSEDPEAPHYHYANYLLQSVTPPKNLPFLKKSELQCPDAVPMWDVFHEQMEAKPLSEWLHSKLSQEEYLWFVSVVMSRRSGLSTLIPMLDKLNHDATPNAYFTMSSETSFCGLDIVDNIVAGVDPQLLLTPYIHLFAINPISAGQPLTICYSDQDPKTPSGRDLWRINWGFTPTTASAYTENELREVAGIVAARRIAQLSTHFPMPSTETK